MDFDFAAFLVLATMITGAIWLLDAVLWAPRRQSATVHETGDKTAVTPDIKGSRESVWVEYSKSFFPVFLIVLILRSFMVEPFRIPSGSMMPTLLDGDFILVNKYSYGIRLPVLDTKIVDIGKPQRGDVAVFRYPREPSIDYIKRVVGIPGDVVEYRDKILYINGKRMDQEVLGIYSGEGSASKMSGADHRQEQLDGVAHRILVNSNRHDSGFRFEVREGQYFVMGDNRDNSNDSRFWGTVPEENLVGEAFMIWMNWDSVNGSVSWSRIGTIIE